MQNRTQGRTGIKVSPYALGTLIAAGKRPEFAYRHLWPEVGDVLLLGRIGRQGLDHRGIGFSGT